MAYTATNIFKSVFGNKRTIAINVTADATSGAIDTGLSVIEAISIGVLSCNTGGFISRINKSSAATAMNGSLHFSACTNGDNFHVVCIGR